MTKYHINPETNRVNICRADKKGCLLQAQGAKNILIIKKKLSFMRNLYSERKMTLSFRKRKTANKMLTSLHSDFKKIEEKFEENHEGIPNRFYNYDLQGKNLIRFYGSNDAENMDMSNVYVDRIDC